MISSLRGRVLHVDAESAIIEVGGVGFSVAVTAQVSRALHIGDETQLHTTLIVRDDALSLYGFAVFGYITASFASFFVGRDAAAERE